MLSLTTENVVAKLNRGADAGHVLVPLALNEDGSLAAVAEQTGRVTLWHVDSGELLLDLQSDTRPAPIEPLNGTPFGTQIAGALAYDASRVALLDEAANTWTVLSLDPGDWVRGACLAGGVVTAERLSENGLGSDLACD